MNDNHRHGGMLTLMAPILRYVLLWGAVCIMLWGGWTGFIASDDGYYVRCGLGWLHRFPFVGRSFGEVRAAVCIPMAASIGLFGEGEFTAVLSTSLFFLGTAALTLAMLSRIIAPGTAFAASAALATVPLLAINATIPNADIPELFFVAGSFWLFWLACQRDRRFWILVLAGIAAALAFSAHEVSLALVVFYGLLFLGGYAVPRKEYWAMVIGFIAILLVEALYYWTVTGNPMHRFDLFLHGAGLRDRTDVGFLKWTPGGTLHVWDPIDPLLMLFTHVHHFGLVAFVSIPALWWTFAPSTGKPAPAREAARLLAGLGLVWLAFAAATLTNQQVLPRYYTVTVYCLSLVAGIWIAEELWPCRPKAAVATGIVVVLAGIAGIAVSNTNPRFGERALVKYLAETGEAVYTDPMTADKARWYCRWRMLDCTRIKRDPPPPGAVFFYYAKNADGPNRLVTPDEVSLYQPTRDWREIQRWQEPQKWPAAALERIGVANLLPDRVRQKMARPNSPSAVFRVPE